MPTPNDQSEGRASKEENFFGVRTTIERPSKMKKPDGETPEIEIEGEATPDKPERSRAEPRTAKPDSFRPDEPKDKDKDKSEDGDDPEQYSEKVQKRINKLTWEREEARRELQKAAELREEAIRAAQALNEQNQNYQQIITSGEAQLVERIKQGAAHAVEAAKSEYRKAYESGDSDEVIAAHEKLINAQAELIQANNYDRDYQSRQQQAQQQAEAWRRHQQALSQQRAQQPRQPRVAKPTSEAEEWAERNPWFNDPRHRDMTALAYATHETLVRDRGFKPDSDAYFEELDRAIQQRFPEYFEQQGGASTAGSRPATVVAPAKRTTSARSRKVKLTPTQVALAKKLGLTLEQYADQVIKGAEHV